MKEFTTPNLKAYVSPRAVPVKTAESPVESVEIVRQAHTQETTPLSPPPSQFGEVELKSDRWETIERFAKVFLFLAVVGLLGYFIWKSEFSGGSVTPDPDDQTQVVDETEKEPPKDDAGDKSTDNELDRDSENVKRANLTIRLMARGYSEMYEEAGRRARNREFESFADAEAFFKANNKVIFDEAIKPMFDPLQSINGERWDNDRADEVFTDFSIGFAK